MGFGGIGGGFFHVRLGGRARRACESGDERLTENVNKLSSLLFLPFGTSPFFSPTRVSFV